MKVILCTHNSGGVGKTSLAVHVAGWLAQEGRVLLIDCDDQADAWKFYAGKEPSKSKDFCSAKDISVITNSERTSIKKLAKPQQYDYVVLDMDTPLPNIVQVILGSDPHLILIPINASQKYKSLENLEATLDVIAQLESKATYPPEVIIVPLGISENDVNERLLQCENKPNNYTVAPKMRNLQDEMQKAIYQSRDYIWNFPNCKDLFNYFGSFINI